VELKWAMRDAAPSRPAIEIAAKVIANRPVGVGFGHRAKRHVHRCNECYLCSQCCSNDSRDVNPGVDDAHLSMSLVNNPQ
jgi:hypothetical protein